MYAPHGKIWAVTERSNLMLAALASATMPNIPVVGVRSSEQENDTDKAAGIDQAVVQDLRGTAYNVYATNTVQGKKRLAGRERAARVLEQSRELAGLGFALDRVVAFNPADQNPDIPAVLITLHPDGVSRPLELFTLDDCASIGATLGAIHRLRPNFIAQAKYPAFTTGQIHAQLTAWIQRLRQAGHIPQEITDSWAQIIDTEGLWSFVTCPVHGGFADGDIIFSGSTITTITNWQNMQVNDPARDLAWIFSKLDETHRNAVITSYGRVLGNRLDDLIMLRANLWVQMEQVGDFIQALNRGDNDHILRFKSQVDRLAHQLGVNMQRNQSRAAVAQNKPSQANTVTVNTLLEAEQRRAQAASQATQAQSYSQVMNSHTGTNSSVEIVEEDRTSSRSIDAIALEQADDTNSTPIPSSATMVIGIDVPPLDDDATGEAHVSEQSTQTQTTQTSPDAQTMLIPLLEREEQALRDAQAGLDSQRN